MDTGIHVAIDPEQPTVDPTSIHALGGYDLPNPLQLHNYESSSYGSWNSYADPDMLSPPGSATINIPQ